VHPLSREQGGVGAWPYSAFFGQLISQGKLKSLRNPAPYTISLIKPNASNSDCWTSNSVILTSGATTTKDQISQLYGSQTRALPLMIRACAELGVDHVDIAITYTY
jgi:hypothetical protein